MRKKPRSEWVENHRINALTAIRRVGVIDILRRLKVTFC